MRYDGHVALVTGAGSGIGRALTLALAGSGAHVIATDISERGLAETEALISSGKISTLTLDVADRAAVLARASEIGESFGPVRMLFNNAGVDLYGSVADMAWKDVDWLMSINVGGVLNCTKAFLPQLLESGTSERPARIVNVSSAFGLISIPYQGAYSLSKFAVRGLSEALRQEMILERRPVTVHCVHPGMVKTNFGTSARVARPEDEAIVAKSNDSSLTGPEKAARLILRGMDRNRARILIGADGRVAAALPRVLGASYSGIVARAMRVALHK